MDTIKESFKDKRTRWLIIGGIIALSLAIGLPIHIRPGPELMPLFASARLSVAAVSFFIVLLALCVALIRLRRAMAKPLIKVAFDEKGEQQTTLIYKDGKAIKALPSLLLINEGDAVARYFQIDFIIPEDIGKQSRYLAIARDEGKYILHYPNDGKYTLFVNKPYSPVDDHLAQAINYNKIMKFPGASFKIEYKVYGDWAETQEGELIVKINKQGGT